MISGNPYWLLPTVLALTKSGQRAVDPRRLAEYQSGIPDGYSTRDLDSLPSLIGTKEVSWVFGKKHSDIGQWRSRGTLASPDLTLSNSPLWLLETILADAEHRGRVISSDAVARIRAGEGGIKSRRSRRLAGDPSQALPVTQIFTRDESVAAVTFIRQVLKTMR